MNYRFLRLLLIPAGLPFITIKAQTIDTTGNETGKREQRAMRHRNACGKFNYRYLRIALPTPSGDFNNPMHHVPEASGRFAMTDNVRNSFTLGLEWGTVRHFTGLRPGTDMLKLGINSGWTMQGFGKGQATLDNEVVQSGDTYLLRLGLGPQLSFKPHEDFRVGVYYRFGLALVVSAYDNVQTSAGSTAELKTTLINAAYNGDLGIDLSWHKMSLGLVWSMLKIQPSKNRLFSSGNDADNSLQQGGVTTVIDPQMEFNRFVISAGFAF